MEKFRVGFAPNNWTWLLDKSRTTPHSPAVLEACGLIGRSQSSGNSYDRFKGRVIFPIRDSQGRTIAFGGRIIPSLADENAAKYINSPETRLFSKSEQFYALDIARHAVQKTRTITVVEGYTDVIMCHQFGVDDVVAVLGTALTERHLPILRRFADRVNLVLDGDEAGQRRTNDILELFVSANMDLRILTLPEEFDPAEFLVERGGDAFRELMNGAVDALEHKIRVAVRGIDLARETHKANQALEEILATIAKGVPLGAMDATALRSNQLLARLAREFRLDLADVRERFAVLRRTSSPQPLSRSSEENQSPERVYKLSELTAHELELLELMVVHPEMVPTPLAEIAEDDLTSVPAKLIFQVYRSLEEAGENLEFPCVMAQIEDRCLKNLLVHIDELAAKKQPKANLEPAVRMRSAIASLIEHYKKRQLRETEARLEQNQLPAEEEISVLDEMIAARRRQLGIITPTEG